MYIELTITAVADRDESCNLLTFSEKHRYSIAMPPTPEQIKLLLQKHKDKYLEMWPHHRQASPTLIPLDVDVREIDN